MGPLARSAREGLQAALGPLGMEQMAGGRVGDGGMGQNELTGRETAGIVRADASGDPEEGHLKTPLGPVLVGQPAGDVPPFRPVVRVGAGIGGKDQGATLDHRGKVARLNGGKEGQGQAQDHTQAQARDKTAPARPR